MDSKLNNLIPTPLFDGIRSSLRRLVFQVLSVGPMPRHIAFIPDGNRRYGRKHNHPEGEAHRLGYLTLMSVMKHCYEMGIQYVSFYGFSIDNFKRRQGEVQTLMNLISDKANAIVQNSSTFDELGVRVEFLGNLDLLGESTRDAVRRAMDATAKNNKIVLLIYLAYTSSDEIVHGVQGSFEENRARATGYVGAAISVEDLERHMYSAGRPDPDILVRTSGETRLSNYLLWQTARCLLYSPRCLWPELSVMHLIWAVLMYQRNHAYLEKIKKKLSAKMGNGGV